MDSNLNLDNLRCFRVFAETLNFTRAAELLFISQPAVHVKVRELGEQLGLTLYHRVGRRLELTEQGKRVARFARELDTRIESFHKEISLGDSNAPVVLAAGAGTYQYLIGDALRQHLRSGKHRLKLLTLDRDGAIDAVQSGRAHLGIASIETVPANLESSLLFRIGQVLVMPSAHALSRKRNIRLIDLQNAQLIVPPADRPHRIILSRLLQNAGVNWEVAVEAGGWELMLKFVSLGLGLAIVNDFGALPRGLVARPVPELPAVHYNLFHLDGAMDANVERLRQALITAASRWEKINKR